MFNKKQDDNLIQELKDRITELETQLNEVANDNGSIIIKQLPNGQIELNGIEIDKDSPVEYYNSSKATYGELTMFRIGKEAKQREIDKLIEAHMEQIDVLRSTIHNYEEEISKLNNELVNKHNNIIELNKLINKLHSQYNDLENKNKNDYENYQATLNETIQRYEGLINGLEEDLKNWKQRYLTINNVKLDGTIITKYGTISSNNQNEGE